jgi:limonene-1,2-epoxide hydrolase
MSEAEEVLRRYLKAQEDMDIEALVSCWHPEVEIIHPMRPGRSWKGRDNYQRFWEKEWGGASPSTFELVRSDVVDNRIYLECVIANPDGTRVPNMNIFEVEDGTIRRGRAYADKIDPEGTMDDFVRETTSS